MANFRINPLTGGPLTAIGSEDRDTFLVTDPGNLLEAGLSQNGSGGYDRLYLLGEGLVITDAAFNGLAGFEEVRIESAEVALVTLDAAAEATFDDIIYVTGTTGMAGTILLDGSAVSAATRVFARGAEQGDTLIGGETRDLLRGQDGDDVLIGGGGVDRLRGGDGADTLIGGAGADRLLGGGGADVFVMEVDGGGDVVLDFEVGIDRIDLSALGVRNFDDALADATEAEGDTVLRIGGEVMVLQNTALATLTEETFGYANRAPTDIYFAAGGIAYTGSSNGGVGLAGIGILGATDPDAGETLTFSLTDPRFGLAFGAFLNLNPGQPLIDYAVEQEISVTITVTDSHGLTYTETLVIPVARPDLQINDVLVREGLVVGARVGEVAALDFFPAGAMTWSVVTGDVPFTMSGDRLVTTATLDFEDTTSYEVLIRGVDAGDGRVVERTITVFVEDQNENIVDIVEDRSFTGAAGAAGEAGEALSRVVYNNADDVNGSIGPDRVIRTGTVTGGEGGAGAGGVAGAAGASTVTPEDVTVVAAGGDGTAGGAGGAGGLGEALVQDYGARLGALETAEKDASVLDITAVGGAGGAGGTGGAGGDSAGDVVASVYAPGPVLDSRTETDGNQGGTGGAGGDGGAGGSATTALGNYLGWFSARQTHILTLTAIGGDGGDGGDGGAGGDGDYADSLETPGGEGGHGGDGGRGGDARVTTVTLRGAFSPELDWTITATATGGDGGRGGDGGAPGTNTAGTTDTFEPAAAVGTTDSGRDIGGNGGDGGDGGDALAEIAFFDTGFLSGNIAANLIRFEAAATGGAGGAGGSGSTDIGADGSSFEDGITTTTHAGVAGLDGANGTRGDAAIIFRNLTVDFGGGDQTVQFAAFFDGETHSLTVEEVYFWAGIGTDMLDLSAIYGGFGATFDVAAGRVTVGTGNGIRIDSVEQFRGTESADTFIDGVSEQVYFGGSGADVFVFAPGHGQDSINDFVQGQDRIDLTAFGYADFSEIEALLGYSEPGYEFPYAVVTTSGGTGISLSVPAPIVLTEADFIF